MEQVDTILCDDALTYTQGHESVARKDAVSKAGSISLANWLGCAVPRKEIASDCAHYVILMYLTFANAAGIIKNI